MSIQFLIDTPSLAGFDKTNTIQIIYKFPGGIQGPQHPNPGVKYTGTTRTCYLPYTEEGIEILELLIIAFQRRLTFTVGTSITTGISNTIVWNGIHHKTTFTGVHGFPDETYLIRVKEELKDMNITPEDIEPDDSLIISQSPS
jgi:deltex-like protein